MNRSQRLDRDLLADIVAACEPVHRFVGQMSEAEFLASDLIQSAVWSKIIVIGEAAANVSRGFRSAHPQVPWREAAGMRNRLIHEYARVDWAIVWRTVQHDLRLLKEQIGGILGGMK